MALTPPVFAYSVSANDLPRNSNPMIEALVDFAFENYDHDADSILSAEEFTEVLEDFNEIRGPLNVHPRPTHQPVNIAEARQVKHEGRDFRKPEQNPAQLGEHAERIIEHFDEDGDKALNPGELYRFIKHSGRPSGPNTHGRRPRIQ